MKLLFWIMTFSVELLVSPTHAVTKVLLNATEEIFAKEEKVFLRLSGVQVILLTKYTIELI